MTSLTFKQIVLGRILENFTRCGKIPLQFHFQTRSQGTFEVDTQSASYRHMIPVGEDEDSTWAIPTAIWLRVSHECDSTDDDLIALEDIVNWRLRVYADPETVTAITVRKLLHDAIQDASNLLSQHTNQEVANDI